MKDELKNLLESYKFENRFLTEKQEELVKIKENYLKYIQKLKQITPEQSNLIDETITKYKSDLDARENELDKIIDSLKEIENLLVPVSQPYRSALYYKYVNGLSVEEIAFKMNYSTQRIYQFLDNGINQIIKKEDVG